MQPVGDTDYLLNRGVADTALRLVDYPAETHGVIRVVYHREVRHDVAYLLAVVEPQTAYDGVRNSRARQGVLKASRLGVAAVQQRVIRVVLAFLHAVKDSVGNETRLGYLALEIAALYLVAVAQRRPELLVLALLVVAYHGVRSVQDILGGTVVLLELYYLAAGILLLEAEDILDSRAAEAVN